MKKIPARVHILMAREAPYAVAIRRGPSKQVCTVGWDRKKDVFRLGQWLKGRIYEDLCDLSPNGEWLIYFAMNHRAKSEMKGSWTAISKTPFLKALGLWSNNGYPWGGGFFTSNRSYYLNRSALGIAECLKPQGLKEDLIQPVFENCGKICLSYYEIRLQRNAWLFRSESKDKSETIFEKELTYGWILEKTAHVALNRHPDKGSFYETHCLKKADGSKMLNFPDWEWADLDGKRLVWIEAGVLFAAKPSANGLSAAKELFDFNKLSFEAIAAPY